MLPGFNHTINYKGQKVHIQTEDHGRERPEIVSHVFLEGKVIATQRTTYKNLLQEKDLDLKKEIKHLMQDQHKKVLKAVVDGSYDKELGLKKS